MGEHVWSVLQTNKAGEDTTAQVYGRGREAFLLPIQNEMIEDDEINTEDLIECFYTRRINAGELVACLKARLKQIVRKVEHRGAGLNSQAAVFNPTMTLPLETQAHNLLSQNKVRNRQPMSS